ncbi:MAG TPA: FAD-dependent oxidoreductase [Longimicrobiales bacterium]|nr:FAD-dependent oxidoreductase [Longimicrobiales bacterium]
MDATGRSAIVVGGGAFGAAGALELASRGWEVRLLDPGPLPHPDAASTDISKIVRMDYGADGFYADLAASALEAWRRWNAEWGVPLYHEDGFLVLAGDHGGPGSYESDSWETLTERGVPLERIDPDLLRRRFPAWNAERFPGGYLNPRAGWAESGRVVTRILDAARDAGASVESGLRVVEVFEAEGRVAGVRTSDGGQHDAGLVVVAAGAWTPSLLPHLREVMWATGQPVLHFRVQEPGRWQPPAFPPWAADIANTGWYGFPALDDGTLKVGHHGRGRRTDPDGALVVEAEHEARCRRFLRDALPALADAPLIASRLCLYCDTFDSDFWIDRDPDREGLVVAAGGSGHGFKFAPVLGGIIADAAEGRENRWAPRFRWRPPGEDRVEPARAGEG